MIGLMFLGVAILWLALTVYLTIKTPRWFGLKNYASWLLRLVLVPLLLVGPFVDEIVGMRQFERLCEESHKPWISADSEKVRRARRVDSPIVDLTGYWINIRSQPESFVDQESGGTFLKYRLLHTSGGRIAGIALLGGARSCAPDYSEINKRIDVDKLIKQGNQP
jgi:hypothetical protein